MRHCTDYELNQAKINVLPFIDIACAFLAALSLSLSLSLSLFLSPFPYLGVSFLSLLFSLRFSPLVLWRRLTTRVQVLE